MRAPGAHSIGVVAQPLRKDALESAGNPAAILEQTFDTERRGFDQKQVQDYLRAVSDSLADAQKREAEMRTRVGKAVRRAEAAEKQLRDAPETKAAENRQVGEDVTSVLDAARNTAEQRVAAAEKSAAKIIAEAEAEAARLRAEAEAVLAERTAEAEVAGADIVTEARADSETIRAKATADADTIAAASADQVTRVRTECDTLIREAEEARAQILEDMERRRREARAQVERLRVGRDRLLRSYEVVRRTLEEATVELKSSLKEAKVRGDTAARVITAEPLATRDQLEMELLDAKMIGRVTIGESPVADVAERATQTSAPDADAAEVSAPVPTAKPALRSAALPRSLAPSPAVAKASKTAKTGPIAPASAPVLKATPAESKDSQKTQLPGDVNPAESGAARPKSRGAKVTKVTGLDGAPQATKDRVVDAELAQLEDDNLDVVEPADEIEEVVGVPVAEADRDPAAINLFEMLRCQSVDDTPKVFAKLRAESAEAATSSDERMAPQTPGEVPAGAEDVDAATIEVAETTEDAEVAETAEDAETAAVSEAAESGDTGRQDISDSSVAATETEATSSKYPGIEAQRDAVIADAAKQLEKRLRRALADEQNELLAGLRAGKNRNKVELTSIVGDIDMHVYRYVAAINEVAAVTYGAGAALIDAEIPTGLLPAGAVEELLTSDVVLPIRECLESLDALEVPGADMHVDPVRAFYRQRKTDHLGFAASRLASLLCVAGVCDALPEESTLPWETEPK